MPEIVHEREERDSDVEHQCDVQWCTNVASDSAYCYDHHKVYGGRYFATE